MTAGKGRRGKGEGGVYQRASDDRWVGVVELPPDRGRRKRKIVYGWTKREAQDAKRALERRLEAQARLKGDRATVGGYVERWIESDAREICREGGSWSNYNRAWELRIKPYGIQAKRLDELDVDDVRDWLKDIRDDQHSAHTRAKAFQVLRQALKQAVLERKMASNPCEYVEAPKAPRVEMKTWTPEEAVRWLRFIRDDRLFALYSLALNAGPRQGELLGLKWKDVDFAGHGLRIQTQFDRETGDIAELKTPGSVRRVELSRDVMSHLEGHRRRMRDKEGRPCNPEDLVFVAAEGGRLYAPNLLRRSFKPLVKRFNMAVETGNAEACRKVEVPIPEIRFHDLRHSHATHWLAAGVYPKVVSERMGHSSIDITLRLYGHVLPGMQRAVADQMGALLRLEEELLLPAVGASGTESGEQATVSATWLPEGEFPADE